MMPCGGSAVIVSGSFCSSASTCSVSRCQEGSRILMGVSLQAPHYKHNAMYFTMFFYFGFLLMHSHRPELRFCYCKFPIVIVNCMFFNWCPMVWYQ